MKRIYKRVLAFVLALFMTITLLPSDGLTVQAEQVGGTARFYVGTTIYNNLQDAITAAERGSDKKIVLANDGTIQGNYTIPEGVILLIPFDEAGTCYTDKPDNVGDKYVTPVPYKTLTMSAGSSITVKGAISVSAKHAAAHGSGVAGVAPSGTYGYIKMENGSAITVESGANLYAWGFVSGSGKITAKSGSTVYEGMQISEFRGGAALSTWAEAKHKAFPFSQYYVQNIEVPLTLEYGATEMVFASVFMGASAGDQNKQAYSISTAFIGDNSGMFSIGEGTTITKYYNPATDRLYIEADGDIAVNGMTISVSFVKVDSTQFVLPITNNITIKLESGSVTINQDVALLPGAEIILERGTVLNISKDCELFVYDRDQWITNKFVHDNKKIAPVVYTPTDRYVRTEADLADAVLDVNGTVNAYGYMYTTWDNNAGTGGAKIISSKGTGKINYINGAGQTTYTNQVEQNVSNVTPVYITVAPAMLQNADGSYTATKNAKSGTSYAWNTTSSGWVNTSQYVVRFDTAGGSQIDTAVIDKGQKLSQPEEPTKTGYKFNGWKDASGNTVTFPMTVTSDTVLTADWSVNKYTFTFVDGDTVLDTITKEYGQSVKVSDPKKEGYVFDGWDAEVPATMPARDMVFKAKWKVETFTLSFVDTDGSEIKTITQSYGTDVISPENPSKAGYTFQYWVNDKNEKMTIPTKMPASNIKYIASWKVNQYTITFDTNGAGKIAPITADYASEIRMPKNPEKEGYTFLYWMDENGKEVKNLSVMPVNGLKLTAKWKLNQYKISFLDEDGETMVCPTITQAYNTIVEVPNNPMKEGHEFVGWVDQNGKPISIPSIMPAKDTTVYASWKVKSYTITFYLDGGSGTTSIKAAYGQTLSQVTDPTKEGFDFLGWKDDSGKLVSVPTTMPAKDMVLTATWRVKRQTLKFVDTDGTLLSEIKAVYGEAITAPATPEKEGYTFLAWTDEKGATVQIPNKMPSKDATYIASWRTNEYNLIFKSDAGIIKSQSFKYGDAITAPTDVKKEGYKFVGWVDTNGKEATIPATMPAYNLTYVAKWQPLVYKVVWLDESGNLLYKTTAEYGQKHSELYQANIPEKNVAAGETGTYVFSGWVLSTKTYEGADYVYEASFLKVESGSYSVVFADEDGNELYVKAYKPGDQIEKPKDPEKEGYKFAGWVDGEDKKVTFPMTMPAHNLYGASAIKATWEVNTYKVTYKVDAVTETLNVEYGDPIPAPKTKTAKEGYKFEGWNIVIPETMPAHDIEATALWSHLWYTITIDTVGGSYIPNLTVAYGEAVSIPEPTKEGYKFEGWNIEIPETMPAEDLTVKAKWKVNTYTVYYYIDEKTLYQADPYKFGEEIDELAEPTREGYKFVGWDITIPETMPAKDVYAIARWVANEYTVSFEDGNGKIVTKIFAKYGDAIMKPQNPVREGYTFTGWVDKAGKEVELPDTMPLGGMTVYASWTCNSYTISFVDGDGAGINAITQKYGTQVKAPTNPTKEGHTFAGWVDENGEVVSVPETMPAKDVTLKAKWTVNEYTITFDTDGGSAVSAIKQPYGSKIVWPANPGKEGYTFAGWDASNPGTMPARNMTVTALWTVNKYTISFDSMGGTAVNPIQANYTVSVNAPSEPVRTGYTFVAWKDSDGKQVQFPIAMPVDGMKLTAEWKINQYTVTFDTDGGSAVELATVDYGTKIEKPENPTREHYTFVGWVDASGKEVAFPLVVGASDITLKAQWKIHKKVISWDTDGDGTPDVVKEIDYGTTADELKKAFVPKAKKEADAAYTYEFIGWTPEITDVLEAQTYTATFKSVPNKYKLMIDVDGGSGTVSSQDYAYGTAVKQPDAPTREGYTFAGWTDKAGNTVEFPFEMPSHDVEIKASWTVNEYTISWDTDGDGTADDRSFVKHGVMPSHTNGYKTKDAEYTYKFTGWSPAVVVATKATMYSAQFEKIPNEYTIKFVDTDGTVIKSDKLAYGTQVTLPANPTKEGYTFTEWDKKIPSKMPAEDVTITARWIVNTYEINWDMDGDGKIDDSTDEAYGTTPSHGYTQKPADSKYTYTFIGWDSNQDGKVDGIQKVTGSATYTAVFEAVEIPVSDEVERIFGKSRYHTSLAIADELKEALGVSKFEVVIIANGENFPDALAGSYLASKKNAPILMMNPSKTTAASENNELVLKYIQSNLKAKGKVYILGGAAAVPKNIENQLMAQGYEVARLSGKGRYDTNLAILNEAGVSNEAVLVCTGTNFADSLSASATGLPILLVDPTTKTLTEDQKTFLAECKREIYVIGGSGAVDEKYISALTKYDLNSKVERIKGASRYETSVAVARKFCENPKKAVVASATKFPDGLCGGPLAYFMDAPLILTSPKAESVQDKKNVDVAAAYISEKKITYGKALGGSGAVSDVVVRTVFGMKNTDKILGTKYE